MDLEYVSLKVIKKKHAECPGPNHCYCQHKITVKTKDGSYAQVEGGQK